MQLYAPLYFVDQPLQNEPALGGYVHVLCKNTTNLPGDLVVTVNGVKLVKATDFRASASGAQVKLGADGMLHVSASSVSANKSVTLDLPCAPLLTLTSTPAAGSSLAGAQSVSVDWSPPSEQMPQNTTGGIGFAGWVYSPPTAQLDSYDLAANRAAGIIDSPLLSQAATGVTLLLRTQSASTGYFVAITYPGQLTFVPDLSTFGYCGRSPRLTFSR
jgi:hypothetical protein